MQERHAANSHVRARQPLRLPLILSHRPPWLGILLAGGHDYWLRPYGGSTGQAHPLLLWEVQAHDYNEWRQVAVVMEGPAMLDAREGSNRQLLILHLVMRQKRNHAELLCTSGTTHG